jgi:hypothetical protein
MTTFTSECNTVSNFQSSEVAASFAKVSKQIAENTKTYMQDAYNIKLSELFTYEVAIRF